MRFGAGAATPTQRAQRLRGIASSIASVLQAPASMQGHRLNKKLRADDVALVKSSAKIEAKVARAWESEAIGRALEGRARRLDLLAQKLAIAARGSTKQV
jgi:hypothetical protein